MSCSRFTPIALAALVPMLAIACSDDAGSADTTIDTAGDTSDGDAPADSAAPPDDVHDDVEDANDSEAGETIEPHDEDGDGLSDEEEAALGTDPTAVDSDEDGYWDGWEVTAGSDPNDPLSTPTLEVPSGDPYILGLVDIIEPTLLRTFLGNILDRWPPILLFVDASAGGGQVVLKGGIAARVSLGPDDTAGTPDDEYGLELGSLDPATGEFQVLLVGTRDGDEVVATADEVIIDLSNVSELVRGVRLRVEDVRFEARFVDGDQRLDPTRLAGILSRRGVEEILENADLPLPIDIETGMQILDPDGDGIIAVDLALQGRPAIAAGWALTPEAEPVPRLPGECCPPGLAVGDPIDSALTIVDQGLQPEEEALARQVIIEALAHPELIDFVATQRVVEGERRTYAYSPRGLVYVVRERVSGEDNVPMTTYRTVLLADIDARDGEAIDNDDPRNPLANQDPEALSDYASFLAIAEPFALTPDYASLGFVEGDERLVRVPLGQHPYPFGYERLIQVFDDPRAPDLILMEASYRGNRGSHGHLSSLQSRSALVISGAGVVRAGEVAGEGWSIACAGACTDASIELLVRDEAARIVDVAPTVAKALGGATTIGVGPDGFLADDVYLAWQDGRPLDHVLSGARPQYAVILINDGLASMELLHQAFDAGRELDGYRELMARGVTFRHGAITNYPSNTYPSHNVVGSGAYSGHHGILDNGFYEREVATVFEPIVELFSTEKFFGGAHANLPVETLHEAVLRSFGGVWHKTDNPAGVITASLNDPSTRGAPLATLERRVPDGYDVPDARSELTLGGETWAFPPADLLDAVGILDNSTLTNAYGLYVANPKKGFPIPRYAIINFGATDSAGHKAGPHGDPLREDVLAKTDRRIRILIEILKEAGIYEDTLIVLTADHGMELKDPNLRGGLLSRLSPDVAYVQDHDFVYLKQLALWHTVLPSSGAGVVTFTVADRDGTPPANLVAGALVIVERDGVELARGTTGPDGTVSLELAHDTGALTATAMKSGFSTETHALD